MAPNIDNHYPDDDDPSDYNSGSGFSPGSEPTTTPHEQIYAEMRYNELFDVILPCFLCRTPEQIARNYIVQGLLIEFDILAEILDRKTSDDLIDELESGYRPLQYNPPYSLN